MTSGFLDRMAAASRERAASAKRLEPEAQLVNRIRELPVPPRLQLATFDLIAELKLRSPSEGDLGARDFDRRGQLEAYAAAGVACVSVLTEPDEFQGSLAHLREAAGILAPHGVPVMRKDFLCDPYQVLEARAAGAGGVLVIVTMLDDAEVRALVDVASDCGLFVLLEGFDAADLARIERLDLGVSRQSFTSVDRAMTDATVRNDASAFRGRSSVASPESMTDHSSVPSLVVGSTQAGLPVETGTPPILAGVNCRNLQTLKVEFARFAELAPHLPTNLPTVAESGIQNTADAREAAKLGYAAALVGTALMRESDPRKAAASYIAAGREGVAAR